MTQPKRPEATREDIERAIAKFDEQIARVEEAFRQFDEALAESRRNLDELRAMRGEVQS